MSSIKCRIVEELGQVGKNEVNLICWNDSKTPVVDLRSWYFKGEEKCPGRGTSIKYEDIDGLIKLLQDAKGLMEDME